MHIITNEAVSDLSILKWLGANYVFIKVFIVEVLGFHCLQCKEGVSGLRDRDECVVLSGAL